MWHDDVTSDEWREHFDAVVADPEYPPGRAILADLSRARGFPSITDSAVAEMASYHNARSESLANMRLAVVPNGGWQKAREFERELSIPALDVVVFNEVDNACTWLGLEHERVRKILSEMHEQLSSTP